MLVIRDSNENEVILNFLRGELDSERFSNNLLKVMKNLGLNKEIILNADLNDEKENFLRKNLLKEFRGYGKNVGLFANFPNIKKYKFAVADKDDLNKIKYINYSYWNKLSKGTSSPLVAAETIREGITIYNVSNDKFLDGTKKLLEGEKFPPCILLTSDYNTFIILEGHSRMTIYGLVQEKFTNIEVYILECDKVELDKWNGE